MGLQDREYYRDDPPAGLTLRRPETMVVTLILINVAVFVLNIFTKQDLTHLGAMQVQTLWHPLEWWKMLTAGFLHDPGGIWHIGGNMFVLFMFGRDVEGIYGKKAFLAFYLSTIVVGSLVWALIEQFVAHANPYTFCFGASGAVSGVLMLYIMHFPKRTILLFFVVPVPAWLLGLFIVLSDMFGSMSEPLPGESSIAYTAHLAGFACGYLFYQSGWTLGRALPGRISSSGFKLPSFKRKPKLRVHDPGPRENVLEGEADRVLAKLHDEGAESLTPREKEILEDYSRRMQQKLR